MKISVITVTYNAEKYVERTLKSVASQCFEKGDEAEHLVVDGMSKDDTLKLVAAYNHVRCVSEPDKGLYDAMNKGLQLAKGDYLVFLNAGDVLFDSKTLQRVIDTARRTCAEDKSKQLPAVVYGQTMHVDDDNHMIDMRHYWAPEILTVGSFWEGMLVCHQSFYVRTDIAREIKYDLQWRLSADYDWCIRVLKMGEKMKLSNANTRYILTRYLEGGISVQNHRISLQERMKIMAVHYGWTATARRHAEIVWNTLKSFFLKF